MFLFDGTAFGMGGSTLAHGIGELVEGAFDVLGEQEFERASGVGRRFGIKEHGAVGGQYVMLSRFGNQPEHRQIITEDAHAPGFGVAVPGNFLRRGWCDCKGGEEIEIHGGFERGSFLKSIDGAFNLADRWKGIMFYNLGYDYYDRFIKTVSTISPAELMMLAQKYFNREGLSELVVGKK